VSVAPVVVRLAPVVLGAVVVHTAVFPQLRPFDVGADGLLLLAVAAGVVAGPRTGAWVGFGAGLLADCFLATPFGLSALVDGMAGWGAAVLAGRLLRPGWEEPVIVGAASAAAVGLFVAIGSVLGDRPPPLGRLLGVALVLGLLHAALAPLALPVLRWALQVPADRAAALEGWA